MKTNLTITARFSSTTADEVTAMGKRMMEILKENGFETECLIESEAETRNRLSKKWETATPKVGDIRTICVKAFPLTFEDAVVNGEHESEDGEPRMPFVNHGCWQVEIDRATGRIAGWPGGTTAEVFYKTVDENYITLIGNHGETVCEYDGYVPSFLEIDDSCGSDYIYITIGPDGTIKNFNFTKDDIYELRGDE